MAAMVKQYGKQKGKEVFYASKNKGTIEGVEETKMSYIDRVNQLLNEREDSHTVYQHIGLLMAEALGFVTEGEEPTGEDLKKANKDVHTRKHVKGETPEETKKFDKSVDDAMGKKRVGAEGGIEGLKAKIRAAGQRSRR